MSSHPKSDDERRAGMQDEPARRGRPAVVAYFNPGQRRPDDAPAAAAASDDAPPADGGEHIYPDDIDEWAERLEVTPEQLRAAIRRVGARADEVERYLGNPDVV